VVLEKDGEQLDRFVKNEKVLRRVKENIIQYIEGRLTESLTSRVGTIF